MKKTYIPSTPRSRKLKSVGGGTINVSGGSAQNVPVIEGHTHDNKIILDAITQLHLRILSSLNVDEDGALIVELSNIIKELDTTVPTDENLFSALRTVLEIRARSISKTDPDTAQEIIKFVKGIEIGTFTTGPLGAGAAIKMENGVSRMEVDQLDVRMRATFRELIIESLKHIGGQLILSPARMKCTSVVDGGTYYKCYFDTGDGKVSNEFVAGDQARCQVFTGSGVKMYWRLVTSVGTDWINLSKTDAISGSSIPEAGDDIVQLGNRSDATRQNAQILSTVGVDAPSWKQYKGINAFSLEGKDTTVFSGTGNKIDGKTVFMSSGANVEDGINSKNSNYSSQPTSYKANDTWTLSADTTVNGIAYKAGEILTATQDSTTFVQAHWVKKVRYTDDTAVNNLQIGTVNLLRNSSGNFSSSWIFIEAGKFKDFDPITVQMWCDNGSLAVYKDLGYGLVGSRTTVDGYAVLTGVVQPYTFNPADDGRVLIIANGTNAKIMVEKATKGSAYSKAPEDVQAAIDAAVVKATYWSIKASAPVIYKDAINAVTSGTHTPVTISGELRSGTTTTSGGFITVTPNGGTEGSATASPVTIAPANGDGKTSYTVKLYDTAAKTTLLDTMTIPVVFKGASGVNAINVVLSNEADVLPASPEGVVSDYSGSGTIIRVFEGATELDYDGIGTTNGRFNVTASATGITVGTKSESGLTCVFANASNMTADNATITFTISGKTAAGASFSITKTQSFAKSRTGAKGDAGVSITAVDVEFAKNTSPTTAPTTGWTTTAPTLSGTEQLWTRTKTTYSSGNPTYSTPANITPKKGDTGQGIDSVTEEFAISSSKTVQPSTGWSTTQPTWSQGQYIWSRVKVVYKNPTQTIYTGYAVSSEWEAINELEIGGRNYFRNINGRPLSMSGGGTTPPTVELIGMQTPFGNEVFKITFPAGNNTGYAGSRATTNSVKLAPKTNYSYFTYIYTPDEDASDIYIYPTGAYGMATLLRNTSKDIGNWLCYSREGAVAPVSAVSEFEDFLCFYANAVFTSPKIIYVAVVQFEKGNKITDFSYSPEDVQAEIEQAQLAADGYMRARYIRDWSGRNTTNDWSAWNEVKVFLKNGTNIAQGKSVTGRRTQHATNVYSRVTDNNIDNTGQPNSIVPAGETDWVRIDLGQVYYDIDYIQVWHFWSDGRTYYGTKTEISEDGVNWTPVFDSAKSGTYKETAAGNVITQRYASVMARLNRAAAISDKFSFTEGGLSSGVIYEFREANSQQVTGLISGIQGADKDLPFLVAGGTYAEGIAGAAKAIIRHDGSGHLANGNIEWDDAGNVELSGKIASGGGISTIGDKIKLNSDGSGQLAGGNIEWDVDGNVVAEGLIRVPFENGDIIAGYPSNPTRLRNYVFTYNNDYTVWYLPENNVLNGVRVMFINWRTSTKTLRLSNTRFFGQWYSGDTKRFDIPVNGYCEMIGFSLGTTFQGWLITNSGTII